jgi:hypothetical protein
MNLWALQNESLRDVQFTVTLSTAAFVGCPVDADFVSDKAALLGDTIKGTRCTKANRRLGGQAASQILWHPEG